MYRFFVKRQMRKMFKRLSGGDYEAVVNRFGPDAVFVFSGSHLLGGERRGADEVRRWFEQTFELFPGLQIEPLTIVVNGWPWNTVAATRFGVRAPRANGHEYRNEGMQFLRLRWGRVVEDRLYEDTQMLVEELARVEETSRWTASASR